MNKPALTVFTVLIRISTTFSQDLTDTMFRNEVFRLDRISVSATGYLHNMQLDNKTGALSSVDSPLATGRHLSLNYQFQLSSRSALELAAGHGIMQKSYRFKLEGITVNGLPGQLDYPSTPNPEQFSFLSAVYLHRFFLTKRTWLSVYAGAYVRWFWGYPDKNMDETGTIALQNEDETTFGTASYFFFDGQLRSTVTFNPTSGIRYEYMDKFRNSWGIAFTAVIPFAKILSGTTTVFPEYDDLRSSFDFNYRGGYGGITLSYSFYLKKRRSKLATS